jgi:hypothetical protein
MTSISICSQLSGFSSSHFLGGPALSVQSTGANTLEIIAGDGSLALTVITPAAFAGTYHVDLDDLENGPVNVVKPQVSGSFVTGETLIPVAGLWVYDTQIGPPVNTLEWVVDGVSVQSGSPYSIGANDMSLVLRETSQQSGQAVQEANSAVLAR